MPSRAKVVKAVGCEDYVIDIKDFLPDYVISSDDIESKYLLAEEYERAFQEIWSTARDIGCNTIMGGTAEMSCFPH